MSMADVILAQNRILKPIASYTHTTNKEVAVSAVDVDTDTFTSVAHGLANNDVIFPIINHDAGAVFPLAVYAGGMAQGTYYVVNKADDAFQISLTNGGAAVNLTTNASIDLTKWHFEKGNTMTIAISNLPAAKEYRAIAKIKSAKIESFYFNPSANPAISPWYNMDWAASGSTVYAFRYFASLNATIYGYIEAFFSTEVHALKRYRGYTVGSNTNIALATATIDVWHSNDTDAIADITAVAIGIGGTPNSFANGTVLEVYRA